MALTFIYGNAGCGKSGYLYDKILKEAEADRKKKFFLIVPQQASLQTQQEIVRRSNSRVIFNIDVVSFERLAYRVFDELGKNDVVLEDTGKTLILRKIALEHEHELTVLRRNIRRPGSIDAIKSMLSEFMQYNVRPEDLRALCEQLPSVSELHDKLADLALLYEAFLEYLGSDRITAELLLKRLVDLAPKSDLLKDAVLAFDGFTGFTPVQNELMEVFLDLASDLYVTVTFDTGLDPYGQNRVEDLFYMSRKMVQTLTALADRKKIPRHCIVLEHGERTRFAKNPGLRHLEANLFRPQAKAYAGSAQPPGLSDCRSSKNDFAGETDRSADMQSIRLNRCRASKQDGSVAFDRKEGMQSIRLFSCQTPKQELEQAAYLIESMIRNDERKLHYSDFAVISANIAGHQKYAEAVFGKYGIPYFVDSRRELLYHPLTECLRAACEVVLTDFQQDAVFRFLRTGLTELSEQQIDALENFVRARGIRGRSGWNRTFAWPASRLNNARDDAQRERLEAEAAAYNEMRKYIRGLLAPLSKMKTGEHTVLEYIGALYDLLCAQNAEAKIHGIADAFEAEGRMEEASLNERIYPIVMDLFDKFAELLGEDTITLNDFSQLLAAGLDGIKIGVVPPGSDTVILGDMERTRLSGVKYLLFVGINDGFIPKDRDQGAILSQFDREELAKRQIELAPTAREEIFMQRFYLYWILTKPSEGIFLFYAHIGPDGRSVRPSYLISYMKKLFPALREESCGEEQPLTPACGMDAYVRALTKARGGSPDERFKAMRQWYIGHAPWNARIGRLESAAFFCAEQPRLTRQAALSLYGRTMTNSVTRLEKFAQCEFAHFLNYGLRLREREEFSFEAVDLGTLYHDVLMRFSQEADARFDWAKITKQEAGILLEQCLEETKEQYADSPLLATCSGRNTFDMIRRVLSASVDVIITQIRRGEYRPVMFEAEFGSVEELSGGARMRLTGKIDRLDLYTLPDSGEAAIRIVDYKSGGNKFSFPEFYYGLQMQLVTYANAAAELLQKERQTAQVKTGGFFYLHLDDPLVDASFKDQTEAQIRKELRLNGILSANPELYEPMDRSLVPKLHSTSDVIPLRLKNDGAIYASGSSAYSDRDIACMCDHAKRKSRQAAEQILAGAIDIRPYRLGTKTGCNYCPYHSICGFDARLDGYDYNTLTSMKTSDILELIGEEMKQDAENKAADSGSAVTDGIGTDADSLTDRTNTKEV